MTAIRRPLSDGARALLACLWVRSKAARRTVTWAQAGMAEYLRKSVRTIKRWVRELVEAGELDIISAGYKSLNKYRVVHSHRGAMGPELVEDVTIPDDVAVLALPVSPDLSPLELRKDGKDEDQDQPPRAKEKAGRTLSLVPTKSEGPLEGPFTEKNLGTLSYGPSQHVTEDSRPVDFEGGARANRAMGRPRTDRTHTTAGLEPAPPSFPPEALRYAEHRLAERNRIGHPPRNPEAWVRVCAANATERDQVRHRGEVKQDDLAKKTAARVAAALRKAEDEKAAMLVAWMSRSPEPIGIGVSP